MLVEWFKVINLNKKSKHLRYDISNWKYSAMLLNQKCREPIPRRGFDGIMASSPIISSLTSTSQSTIVRLRRYRSNFDTNLLLAALDLANKFVDLRRANESEVRKCRHHCSYLSGWKRTMCCMSACFIRAEELSRRAALVNRRYTRLRGQSSKISRADAGEANARIIIQCASVGANRFAPLMFWRNSGC